MTAVGVLDVGGSHATAARIDPAGTGRPEDRRRIDIDSAGEAAPILDALAASMRSTGACRWMLALPGPFDYDRGIGTFDGVGKFGSLAGIDLRLALADRLGADPNRIGFVNDAVAYATGEWWLSDERADRFVCVTLGTGVGSAFLDRGRAVDRGPEVPEHGWVHLLEIEGRPLEERVSTAAIRAAFRRVTGLDASVLDIADRARAGDDAASEVISSTMGALGAALAPWMSRFEATELVVGGSMARSWDLFGRPIRHGMGRVADGVLVRPALAIDDAPLIGAAVHADQRTS